MSTKPMTFEDVVKATKELACGDYFRVQVQYKEHSTGDGEIEWQLYTHSHGLTTGEHETPQGALEEMRLMIHPENKKPADPKTIGVVKK